MHLYGLLQAQKNRNRIDDIPNTTENCIIFHRTREGFDYGLYVADFTFGKLTLQDVGKTLSEVEKTIISAQQNPPSEYYAWTALCWFMVFVISAPLIVVFFLDGTLLAGFAGLSNLCFGFWCEHKAKEVKEKLILDVVENHNLKIENTGFQWLISGENPKWIELHNLYLVQDQEMQENIPR